MKKFYTILLSLLLMTGISAFAQDMSIGLIDLPQVMQHSKQVQAINQKLQEQFKPQQEKILAAQKNIRTEAQKLNPNQAKNLQPAEKQAIQAKIAEEQKNLQTMVVSFQKEVSEAQSKEMKAFIEQVNTAVKEVAQSQKLSVVLLKPAVVYAADSVDITQEVINNLSK